MSKCQKITRRQKILKNKKIIKKSSKNHKIIKKRKYMGPLSQRSHRGQRPQVILAQGF